MKLLANIVPLAEFSFGVFVSLLAVLLLSAALFWTFARRRTTQRYVAAVSDWAPPRGVRLARSELPPPEPLSIRTPLRPLISLASRHTFLLIVEAQPPNPGSAPPRWHALLRDIESQWTPTGLRPTHAATSMLDLYSLSSFPAMGETD